MPLIELGPRAREFNTHEGFVAYLAGFGDDRSQIDAPRERFLIELLDELMPKLDALGLNPRLAYDPDKRLRVVLLVDASDGTRIGVWLSGKNTPAGYAVVAGELFRERDTDKLFGLLRSHEQDTHSEHAPVIPQSRRFQREDAIEEFIEMLTIKADLGAPPRAV